MKLDRRQYSNPCHLGYPTLHDKQRGLNAVQEIHRWTEWNLQHYGESKPVQLDNIEMFYRIYERAVELLTAAKLERYVKYLTYALTPRFSQYRAEFGDSKIGGMPSLGKYLHMIMETRKRNGNAISLAEVIKLVWPRCGCCHESMVFVGQFDLLPWAAPIHCATQWQITQGSYPWAVSGLGGKDIAEHNSIFENKLLQVFMCRNASGHFDNPGMDCFAHISAKYKKQRPFPGEKEETKIDTTPDQKQLHDAFEEAGLIENTFGRLKDDEIGVDENQLLQRIDGYDLRLEFDWGRDFTKYKQRDALDEIAEANPEVFLDYRRCDYKLFGEARSQQEPKRYFSTNAYVPHAMTPTLYFSDHSADMSYQLYFDLISSDGYKVYGKTDASCT